MTWNRRWIKLWVEMLDDPKYQDLEMYQQAIWVNLLLATARSPEPGSMLRPGGEPMTAEHIRRAVGAESIGMEEITATLARFEKMGMVHWNHGTLVITNWHRRQAPRDATAAERMRRYRERQRRGNGKSSVTDVTPHVTAVTDVTPHVTAVTDVTPHVTAVTDVTPHVTLQEGGEGQRGRGVEEKKNVPSSSKTARHSRAQPTVTDVTDTGFTPVGEPVLADGGKVKTAPVREGKPVSRGKRKPKSPPDPKVENIRRAMRAEFGYPDRTHIDPIPNPAKEGQFIKKMLGRGFAPEAILAEWQRKVRQRGRYVSMQWVNEDIGVTEVSYGQTRGHDRGRPPPERPRKEHATVQSQPGANEWVVENIGDQD